MGLVSLAMGLGAAAVAQARFLHRHPHYYSVNGFLDGAGDQCYFSTGGEHPTSDFGSFGQDYFERFGGNLGARFTNAGLACVGRTEIRTGSATSDGPQACDERASFLAPSEDVTFGDGEEALICDIPDIENRPRSHVRNLGALFDYVPEGPNCRATITTADGVTTIFTRDSFEVDETYTTLNGSFASAVITDCVGKLPAKTPLEPTEQADTFTCSENNPFKQGAITGYGFSYTFPDRQYEQVCEVYKHHRGRP
jgi:hypothetical protein